MTTSTTAPTAAARGGRESATYTLSEAGREAGVSLATMRRLVDAGRVPGAIRIGRSIRIRRDQFDAFLAAGGHRPAQK